MNWNKNLALSLSSLVIIQLMFSCINFGKTSKVNIDFGSGNISTKDTSLYIKSLRIKLDQTEYFYFNDSDPIDSIDLYKDLNIDSNTVTDVQNIELYIRIGIKDGRKPFHVCGELFSSKEISEDKGVFTFECLAR